MTSENLIIENLSHDGRGIARVDGKTVFVFGALPQEHVQVRYTRKHRRYAEALATAVEQPSSIRVVAPCAHFGVCGGCALQHMDSSAQLDLKRQTLEQQLKHFGGITPESWVAPIQGARLGYRRKARLAVKYVGKKDAVLVGFREQHSHLIADVQDCLILYPSLATLLQPLRVLIRQLHTYQAIPQLEVAAGDEDVACIVRHLQALTDHDKQCLIDFAKQHAIAMYLQPEGPSSVHRLWPEQGQERLSYRLIAHDVQLYFHPQDFIQVHGEVNQKLVGQALDWLELLPEDKVLDLFCGLGNFTLPIARHVAHVVGVEGDQAMVKRADENAEHNQLTHAQFFAQDLTKDWTKAPFAATRYDKLLLDPPRSGALEVVQRMAHLAPKRIVYVSCNPATLARDAGVLQQQGYRLKNLGLLDMFPHTQHVEAIALFDKM